jgi:hypothetical protein
MSGSYNLIRSIENVGAGVCVVLREAGDGGCEFAGWGIGRGKAVDRALDCQDRLMPLHEAIFVEPGLAGAKYGHSKLGMCSDEVRMPLTTLMDGTKTQIDAATRYAGLKN